MRFNSITFINSCVSAFVFVLSDTKLGENQVPTWKHKISRAYTDKQYDGWMKDQHFF